MANIKILGIAPYPGLKKLLENEGIHHPNLTLNCWVGDLEAGLEIAMREIRQTDYDLVISRGGTATLLKEKLTLPVIDVGVSRYDILQMLQASKAYMGKRALVGFKSITTSAGAVAEILQDDIAIFTIHDQEEVTSLLKVLKDENFNTVLGDMVTTKAAKQVGLNYVQVVSSSESIERSLDFATLLGKKLYEKKQTISYYQQLLHTKKLSLLLLSHPAKQVIYADSYFPIQKQLLKKIHLDSLHTQVVEIENQIYTIEKQQMDADAYLLSIEQKPFLKFQGAVTERATESEHFSSFDMFYRITETTAFFKMIASYSIRDDIVFITGETGTGADYIAELLHRYSLYKEDTWYEIDCSKVTDQELHRWLTSTTSFFYENKKVIYWKNINKLSRAQLIKLQQAFTDTMLVSRNKVICSFSMTEEDTISKQVVETIFEENLALLHIYLTPLRERQAYIPNLATIYINKLNRHYERQVVGFDQATLRELELYYWPGNYGEFKRVIKESFYLAEGSYIKAEQLQQVIKMDLTKGLAKNRGTLHYQQDETLETIIEHFIEKRLQEKGMNKTKLASTLGISRTTLWRYIRRT